MMRESGRSSWRAKINFDDLKKRPIERVCRETMVKREERKRERRWQTEQFFSGPVAGDGVCLCVCLFM